jgi:hypothetical protein|eukprot:COSAG06_NODE_34168_length_478_cov_2.036939_1_plen_113_part_00
MWPYEEARDAQHTQPPERLSCPLRPPPGGWPPTMPAVETAAVVESGGAVNFGQDGTLPLQHKHHDLKRVDTGRDKLGLVETAVSTDGAQRARAMHAKVAGSARVAAMTSGNI